MQGHHSSGLHDALQRAAALMMQAEALLVCAGAGMGVDSGLPDFRGDIGFWKAYPALGRARLSFVDMANAQRFQCDPVLAWGFYGHRLALYRAIQPHRGFELLRQWGQRLAQQWPLAGNHLPRQIKRAGADAAARTSHAVAGI